jgi:antirestriction protein ArdC
LNEINTEKNRAYESLTPQRKQLVDTVLSNLEKGTGIWEAGWVTPAAPESAVTGKKYRGVNNFFLSLISMAEGYKDNRWMTFNQMTEKGWNFKTNGEGNSLAKGKGAAIEFFEFRDKKTKQPYDKRTCDGMTDEEKDEYWKENVVPIRKFYRVFNGDLIEGIPEKERREIDPDGKVERAEKIIDYWDRNEAKIVYGGNEAFYRISTDEIHLPEKRDFYTLQEFYGTAMHEIGHSTGHEKRLNRDIKNAFGSENYAEEELRAEIASMFIAQDLEIALNDSHIQNNSAYIRSWYGKIKENPNVLFTAISDADKISKFVMSKENVGEKRVEYYAVVSDVNVYDETVYKVYTAAENGQTVLAVKYGFSDREALDKEFQKMQGLSFWQGGEFKEVSFEELQRISVNKAKEKDKEEEIAPEKSKIFFPPSVIVARAATENAGVDMTKRGVESLTKMSDREVVERAGKTKNGDKFTRLYNGMSVLGSESKDERSLMARLAMFCNGDKGQLLRVFCSSGQYRSERPQNYYSAMAEQSMDFISDVKAANAPKTPRFGEQKNVSVGANAKA